MKIQITLRLAEYKDRNGDVYKELKKLMMLATKGIIAQHAGRIRGMGNNVWADFTSSVQETSVIELEDEEEKKVEA